MVVTEEQTFSLSLSLCFMIGIEKQWLPQPGHTDNIFLNSIDVQQSQDRTGAEVYLEGDPSTTLCMPPPSSTEPLPPARAKQI